MKPLNDIKAELEKEITKFEKEHKSVDEEELEYKRYYKQHEDNEFIRLTNLDRNTPISSMILLRLGAVPYYILDMRFLVVKLKGCYFDFVKDNGEYYKW